MAVYDLMLMFAGAFLGGLAHEVMRQLLGGK